MLVTQDTKKKGRNLERGGGWEHPDGGGNVVGMEEQEQVRATGGRAVSYTHLTLPTKA